MNTRELVYIVEGGGAHSAPGSLMPSVTASPAAVFPYVAEHPVHGVLVESVRGERILSLQCDGGSVVCNVPSWVLTELERREMLPNRIGAYLRENGLLSPDE